MTLDLFIHTPLINLEDRELCYFPNKLEALTATMVEEKEEKEKEKGRDKTNSLKLKNSQPIT